MVEFPPGWDPESAGSRFTSRAALVILTRRGGADRFEVDSDSGVASEVITDAIGLNALEPDTSLGTPEAVDGADGRGASARAPVIEWTTQIIIGGIVGNAAWAVAASASRRLREMIAQLRDDGVRFNVSRGTAALIAIGHVLDQGEEDDVLDVEAEPSTMAGATPHELNYAGADPWLVFLVKCGQDMSVSRGRLARWPRRWNAEAATGRNRARVPAPSTTRLADVPREVVSG